ncbi:MAG: hypothetical protein H7Y32_13330, partial [Chloroflexales bacterium]|nr:hypothetical protein [Chloroflexales bacterium]
MSEQPQRSKGIATFQIVWPWLLVLVIGGAAAYGCYAYLVHERGVEPIVW